MQHLFAAPRHDQEQTDRFRGTIAGTGPIAEFFAPQNLARIGKAPTQGGPRSRRPVRWHERRPE